MKNTNFYVMRAIYAIMIALMLGEVLYFTAWIIRDRHFYQLASNAQMMPLQQFYE